MTDGELPASWARTPLAELLKGIETGKSFKCDERPPMPEEIGVVKVSAVSWGEYREQESKTCLDAARINPSLFVQQGDFLFSRSNTIELVGACVIAQQVDLHVMLSDKILRFQFADEAMKPWVLNLLRSHQGRLQIESLASGNQDSMRNIGQERIGQIEVPLPPSAEQTRIVAKLEELLSDLDAGVAELKAAQKKLAQYRQSLLKAAVEGALTAEWRKQRLPPLPNPSPTGGEGLNSNSGAARAPFPPHGGEATAHAAKMERIAPLPPGGGGAGGEGANTPATEDELWLQARARELRQQQTPDEQSLWQQLRARRFSGHKFRRQQPLGRFIVDFVCFAQRLIVELDGGQHAEAAEYDSQRDAWLKQQGFRVLRFWNNEWSEQPEAVLESIWQALQQDPPLPNPSPARGEGLEIARIARPVVASSASLWREEEAALSLPGNKAHALRDDEEAALAPLSPCGRGVGGEGSSSSETGAQLLQRILRERRARWEAKQLARFAEQGKTPPRDWQKKYPEPVQPDTSGLPELPEGWVWASVEQLGHVQLGRQRSPNKVGKANPTPYIRAANITEDGVDLGDVLEMDFSEKEKETFALNVGDVLLTEASGSPEHVGRPAIWRHADGLYCFQNTVLRFSPNGICSEYAFHFFLAMQKLGVFSKLAGGVGINHLSAGKFSKLPVPLPPMAEQSVLIDVIQQKLSLCDEQLTLIEKSLKQSAAQRKNILKAAFAGQLVPQDPNDEPASVLLERIRTERVAREAVKKPRGRAAKEASR